MTLHIFNPEHDLALASNLSNFTAPHAGRQLRHDLGWLPALWTGADDVALVDDVDAARKAAARRKAKACIFIDRQQLANIHFDSIEPWGWNPAIRSQLIKSGVDENVPPSEEQIAIIRQLSHRRTAALLLPQLHTDGTIGEAFECTTKEAVLELLNQHNNHVVLKAPWSSSGRGIRFLHSDMPSPNIEGWLHNIFSQQGSVMVEPYYNKVRDFGMEFTSDGQGHICYLGLSLFHTTNGAYTGNVIATEQSKRQQLGRYLSLQLLDNVQEKICQHLETIIKDKYKGPFGVDMMIVGNGSHSCLLHPCVEINLRRTMGHVALAIGQRLNPGCDDEYRRVMRIEYTNNNYKLRINRL
ncbi:MAG: hypothetical protein K5683_11185 [Prevotella sp.]|nr:hypothetical protein [Prevotella sp.]